MNTPQLDSRSLGLVPNATEVEVRGYAGPADEEVDIHQFVSLLMPPYLKIPTTAEDFDDIWVSAFLEYA